MEVLQKKGKLFKLVVCLGLLVGSPVLGAAIVNGLPAVSVAARQLATLSAGISMGQRLPQKQGLQSEGDLPAPNTGNQPQPPETTAETMLDDSGMLSVGDPVYLPSHAENEDADLSEITVNSDLGPKPYPESIETRSGVITAMAYGPQAGNAFFSLDGGGQVKNTTSVTNAALLAESRLLPEFKFEKNPEPQVLIMHTHTTESYEPYTRDFYDASFSSRTTDESHNVVAVGNNIEQQLRLAGIGVIHDRTIHDYPSYNGSYDRSAVTVKAILDQNPSIKIVLDIHRDAIERTTGERIAPTVTIDGRKAAQIMIISGCDDGSFNMPNYMQNFRLASLLQQRATTLYPGFTRPVMFMYKKYNQDLTTGSLLVEMGGHANSLDEAAYAGELLGKTLAGLF